VEPAGIAAQVGAISAAIQPGLRALGDRVANPGSIVQRNAGERV